MSDHVVPLDPGARLWDRVFTVAPLVLVGTREPDGSIDLAPKHLAIPVGWQDRYAFVCSPRHATHRNIVRTGEFTVSYMQPDQVVGVGQAAAPRVDDGSKPTLTLFRTRPATKVEGALVEGAYLWLECEIERVVDDLGDHSLIMGRIVAAAAVPEAVRDPDRDDADTVHESPLLVYLSPTRFAVVDDTISFPFPLDFRR